ncbi:hypothetical protein K3722_16480 [Leisingera caerulea]|uniref:Uncharacterized protein n=1 Tax=Leisingera caerulea TaxID=506591 RepID=A0ABY5WUX6_LEICA|nr:hypothetical protein [Leisingera caerulea]UWQ58062.1 hypothetical protein K3722_16480 [Leisingera caerulea]
MLVTFITESQIKTIKGDLLHISREAKLVSSSHLSEALAHAFGFKTHAALCAGFKSAQGTQCVEFCAERFWRRLSELACMPMSVLQGALNIDLPKSVARASATRDLRESISLPAAFEARLERFFKLMADHGADYFEIEGALHEPNFFGYSGSYRPGRQAMRPSFTSPVPRIKSDWSVSSWSALLADDFLEDHAGPDCRLSDWALEASQLLENSLRRGNVMFSAVTGLLVNHDEVEGCTASVLYQRPGQLEDIQAADMRREPA